jgi:hypothetical protein
VCAVVLQVSFVQGSASAQSALALQHAATAAWVHAFAVQASVVHTLLSLQSAAV